MTLETYHRKNKAQRLISEFISPFIKDESTINGLQKNGIETYTPLLYRIKVGVYLIALGISLFIPFTTSGLLVVGRRWLK